MVSASGLLYCGLWLLLAPAADFRYLYWTVLSVLLAATAVASGAVRGLRGVIRPASLAAGPTEPES
jgi:hypothetical protein